MTAEIIFDSSSALIQSVFILLLGLNLLESLLESVLRIRSEPAASHNTWSKIIMNKCIGSWWLGSIRHALSDTFLYDSGHTTDPLPLRPSRNRPPPLWKATSSLSSFRSGDFCFPRRLFVALSGQELGKDTWISVADGQNRFCYFVPANTRSAFTFTTSQTTQECYQTVSYIS